MTPFNPYLDYKESGVEWMGKIPSGWRVDRIKLSVESARNGVWGEDPDGDPKGVWCVRVADFDRPHLSVSAGNRTTRSITSDELANRSLRKGDLLLEKSGGGEKSPVGFVVRFNHEGQAVCSNFVARIRLRKGMDSRFWTYVHAATYNVRLTQRSIKQTSGIQNLDHTSYFNERAPFPPANIQTAIADFLDHETSRIDELITKQERLIELLAEKRQAIITQAVTKGLDSSVPTKPSGIPWLGDIAADWERVTLKHAVSVLSGFPFKSEDFTSDPNGVRLLRGINVNPGATSWAETVRLPATAADNYIDYHLQAGDILLGLDRPIVSRGTRVCTVQKSDLPSLLVQRVARIRTNARADQTFIAYVLSSQVFAAYLAPLFTGVSVPHMSPGQLLAFTIALPSTTEQLAIVKALASALERIEVLTSKASEAISLLQERRSALISAAVTGKIDVREGAA